MDATTIDRIQQLALAAAAANVLKTDTPAMIIDGKVVTIEHLQEGRARFRGAFATSVLEDFAHYVSAASVKGEGFIDPKSCSARVFLNLGDVNAPGHADWVATLALEPTAAFAALRAIDGKPMLQKQAVEWIEDWAQLLAAKNGATADSTSIATALQSIRSLTISAKSETTHTDKDFGASRTSLEEIEARSQLGIPSHLVFTCEPYVGLSAISFVLRLSVISGDKPSLVLRMVSREALEEDIALEFKTKLVAAIGDSASMTIGSFKP